MPTIKDDKQDFDWELTTWEGSRREQLRRWSRLSLEQILAAQEEMAELSDRLTRTPRQSRHKKLK